MRNAKLDLISWKRIVGCFALQVMGTDWVSRVLYADNYHVNLNVLLDQDDEFLFKSEEFRRIIKTVSSQHDYLLNPNFDVSVQCSLPAFPRNDKLWPSMSSDIFNRTFNCTTFGGLPYLKMLSTYETALEPWQEGVD